MESTLGEIDSGGAQEMQGNGDRLGRHVIGADELSAARQKRH